MSIPNDLSIARSRLINKKLSFVIVKNGQIIAETKAQGIKELVDVISQYGVSLQGAALADKVVGKAAMLLAIKAQMASVYANLVSISALETTSKSTISVVYDRVVKTILNRKKDDTCPFEKVVKNIDDPKKAFDSLKACSLGR